jgi:hypothetical protein
MFYELALQMARSAEVARAALALCHPCCFDSLHQARAAAGVEDPASSGGAGISVDDARQGPSEVAQGCSSC